MLRSIASLARPYPPRTHSCGALSPKDVGKRVVLAGWLLPERKMKTINKSFFGLKDSHGTTQLLADPATAPDLAHFPLESTVLVHGTVALRPPAAQKDQNTGAIDVLVHSVRLLNPADPHLPFVPSNNFNLPTEELRARYRYLDLRRSVLSHNLKKRSDVAHLIRNALHDRGFTEVETPALLRSSPEGAREFLVPARPASAHAPPVFYALAQSPQQPKQMLICSGAVDKYYQIAKCFRDEDGRKDRQPEFTQVDLEMAFVSWGPHSDLPPSPWRIGGHEVRDVTEHLVRKIWKVQLAVDLPTPFHVLTYNEAMTRFGSDKPDTRFPLHIITISDLLPANHPSPPHTVLDAIVVRSASPFAAASRAVVPPDNTERLTLDAANCDSWLLSSTLASHVAPDVSAHDCAAINSALDLRPGDDVWLSSRPRRPQGGSTALGRVRLQLAEHAQSTGALMLPSEPHFLWVTEFPLFTRADEDKDRLAHGRWSSSHHPFTAPMWEDVPKLFAGPIEEVRGQHYDLVLNGVEIGGGSVRVHDATMQDHIFTHILQLDAREKEPFEQLLHALRCGAPPHGGIALGFDRLMAILCNTQSIRDVIAFPKTGGGADLLFRSPAPAGDAALAEYGIAPRTKPKTDSQPNPNSQPKAKAGDTETEE